MAPEHMVRLRLLGFTKQGIEALEYKHPQVPSWENYVSLVESLPSKDQKMHVDYWNMRHTPKEEQ